MRKTVLSLTDPEAQENNVSGNKAATLAKMTAAGLPVPPGFIVPTEVFADSLRGSMFEIDESLEALRDSDLDAIKDISDRAQQTVLGAVLNNGVVSAVATAYQGLGQGAVSVRSSATAEDLPDASFAGQYDSFLNVLSLDQVIDRIVRVWASLYSPWAIAYRRRFEIEDSSVRMAVLVQRQLDPDAAGVLLTQDPITGRNQFVINAALGLGEGVVAGTASIDRFVVEPSTGALLSSEVVDKEYMIVGVEEGDVRRIPVPELKQSPPALSQERLIDLVNLGRRITELFAGPQDVEFAIVDGDVHVLQARPMTAIETTSGPDQDWEQSIDTSHGWLLHPVLSRSPMYRLQEDATKEYLDSQRICFEETGAIRSQLHIAHFVNGFVYARSPDIDDEVLADRQDKHAARWDEFLERGTSYFEAEIQPKVEQALEGLRRLRRESSGLSALTEYLEAAMVVYGYVLGHLHWCQLRPGPRPDWQATYHEITGEPPGNANVFLQAIQNRTTILIARLRNLARIVRSDSELAELFKQGRFEQLNEPEFRNNPAAQALLSNFKRMLHTYGLRTGRGFGSSSEFDTATWNMDPVKPLELIASYADQDLDRLDGLEHRSRRDRQNAVRRTRRGLSNDPEGLTRFEKGLSTATNHVRFMENHNYLMEQCTHGSLREAIDETGKALVARNMIDEPDDVLHISLRELKEVAREASTKDLRPLVSARSLERQHRAGVQPPQTLGEGPAPTNPFSLGALGAALPKGVGLDGNIIRGVSASGGRISGIARLALPGADTPKLRTGDILIAENVGPEWTPMFGILGGLVLDQGAVYQHAALVAREYRLPAVIQTKNATTSISEGQRILLDGDKGIVELGAEDQ